MFFLLNSIFSMPKFIKHNNSLSPQRAGASIYIWSYRLRSKLQYKLTKNDNPEKNSKSNSLKQLPPAAALIQGDTTGNNHLKGGNPNGLHTVSHSQDTVVQQSNKQPGVPVQNSACAPPSQCKVQCSSSPLPVGGSQCWNQQTQTRPEPELSRGDSRASQCEAREQQTNIFPFSINLLILKKV